MLRRNSQLIISLVVFLIVSLAAGAQAQQWVCGHDFNKDGDYRQAGETGTCTQTDVGDPFCPLAPAPCIVIQKDASCPPKTTLNTDTHQCEAAPTCTTGTYDTNSKTCLLFTAPICPAGSNLNLITDKCEAPVQCSSGNYDNTTHTCIAISSQACPDGTLLDSTTGKCLAVPVCLQGTYNPGYNACLLIGTDTPQCPTASTLNATTGKCEAAPICDAGTFNAQTNLCMGSVTTTKATCVQGTTLDLMSDTCEGNAVCMAGTTFNNATELCLVAPGCGAGMGTYDKTLGMCSTPGTDYMLNVTTAQMWAAMGNYPCGNNCTPQEYFDDTVIRVTGILQTLGIGGVCPAGTIIDQRYLTCAAAPDCPTGSTLDLTSNLCTALPACTQGIYDATTHQCIIMFNNTFTPVCPDKTLALDPNSDLCISDPVCVAGTTLNFDDNTCEAPIGCPSGVFDTVRNYCVVPVDVTCPTGAAYDSTTQLCEAPYTCPAYSTYDATKNACSYGTSNKTPICPPGGAYDSTFGFCNEDHWIWQGCDPGYTQWFWDGGYGILCKASPTCQNGYLFSGGTCKPKPAVPVTCPASTTFDTTTQLCEATPTCPLGSSYDSVTHGCSTIVNPTCVVGTNINFTTDVCQAPLNCNLGFTFNPNSHQCEAVPTCIFGSHYDTTANTCVQDPGTAAAVCPSNTTLNTTDDWCEGAPPCVPGTTFNTTTSECQATPLCANGTLTFSQISWAMSPGYQYAYCEIPAMTSPPICLTGTTLDTSFNTCTTEVQCPQNTYFDTITRWCEANPVCPPNSYYYPSLGVCVTSANTAPTCPSGLMFDGVSDLCIQSPICSSGTYDKARNICNINSIMSPQCPSGTHIDSSLGECVGIPTCAPGSVYSATLKQCTATFSPSCIAGLMVDATTNVCDTVPSCPANTGAYDSYSKQCELTTAPVCPPTLTLDRTIDTCTTVPSCSVGNFDPSTNNCQNTGGTPTAAICPTGTTLNPHTNKCASVPLCSVGTYDLYLQECTAPLPCPGGMVLNSQLNECVAAASSCPDGSSLDTGTGLCLVDPACASGALYDPSIAMCVQYLVTCPYNTATTKYACPLVGGVQTCSADPCVLDGTPLPPPTNNLTNNGPVDNKGQCLGQILIFNGTSGRCLLRGCRTITANCCAMPIPENVYNATSDPYNRYMQATNPGLSNSTLNMLTDYLNIFQGGCDMSELMLNIRMKDKKTHYIGEYCVATYFNYCFQPAQEYCVFNSVLARIIQEQGRLQLKRFQPDGKWGTPDTPNCEGFTIQEFQMLDFSKIDLSEFIELIKAQIESEIASTIANKMQNFYNNTLPAYNP